MGALNLETDLYRAMRRLQASNPQPVWAEKNVNQVGAHTAGEVYLEGVQSCIPSTYHDSVRNLAAIAWNRDMIAPRDGRSTLSILTPVELASSTLRAAVLNYTDATTLRSLQRDIAVFLSPSATSKAVAQSRSLILSSLPLESSDPHRRFITHIADNVRSADSGSTLLQVAWGQVRNEFHTHVVSDLLRIESSVLATIKLSEQPFRGNNKFVAGDVVSESLLKFEQICRHNLLWNLIKYAGKFEFRATPHRPARVIDRNAIAEAVPVSRILAGVPYAERAKLTPATQ